MENKRSTTRSRDRDIPWSNCVSFSSDNCSVMIGKNNSVLSRVKEANPNVYDLGCVCHLANICIQKAVKTLPIDDLLVEVFYHFHHSAKRKEIYQQFRDFTDTDSLKILKHCQTRWLSLEKCVTRLLHQWKALKSYFTSHNDVEKPGRIKRVADWLADPLMWLLCAFLEFVLPFMNEFNTTFQSGESMIGHLHGEMTRLLRKLLGRFVTTKVIREQSDLTKVPYQEMNNQHDDDRLAVGWQARDYMENNEVNPEVTQKFFRDPFAVDPLPKAYYYPSPERCLNNAEKATAIKTSFNLEEEEGEKKRNEKTDPVDEIFLKGTNMYRTKPSGLEDVEDEDNFDETWPSSERPSALSLTGLEDESPVNLNKYLSQLEKYGELIENTGMEEDQVNAYGRIRMPGSTKQGTGASTSRDTGKPSRSKIPVKNAAQGGKTQGPQDVKLVNDTDNSAADGAVLQRYIDRFRHSRPTSREEREKGSKSTSQDFWWLSNGPPPATMPPATKDNKSEGSTSHTIPLTTVNLDEYKHLQQLAEKQRTHAYIPESPGDKRTIELQERAEKLLERSSSTVLSTEPAVSTEGLGSNTSDMSSLDEYSYRPKFASYLDSDQRMGNPQLGQPPLLGQELHGGQRAGYQSLVPPPLPGQREPAEDDPLYQWRLRRRMELAQQSAPQHTQQFDFINKSEQQKKIDQKLEEFKQRLSGRRPARTQVQFTPAPQPCSTQMTHMHNCNNIQQAEEQRFHEPQIASPSLHPPKPKCEPVEEIDPHLHLMCDLLPCPHRGTFQGTVDTRASSKDKENFSNDIKPKDGSSEGKEKPCFNRGKYKQYLEAEKPDVEKVPQERDTSKVYNRTVNNKDSKNIEEIENLVKDIGGKDDDEQRSERNGDENYNKSVRGRDINERSERKVQKDSEEKSNEQSGSDSECSHTKSKHLDREVSIDGRSKESEGKRDKVIKPKHSSSPKSGRRGVNAAIDQVIKEHLFCTSTSTVLSSVDSLPPSASSERLPWKQKPPSNNQAHDQHVKQQDDDTPYESDEDFSDDNLLQMLRRQRAMYEHQLQEIDNMLNKMDSR